jgi:peptidoglycan/xylan/chitin deacetylase (PgdA/CDA1 family)
MLSWDEIRVMHRGGIGFGSHTATHPILSRVDRAQARVEIVESKRKIEEELGVVVEGFAYPNGTRADFLSETKSLLQEAGYLYAVTTIPGSNESEVDAYGSGAELLGTRTFLLSASGSTTISCAHEPVWALHSIPIDSRSTPSRPFEKDLEPWRSQSEWPISARTGNCSSTRCVST